MEKKSNSEINRAISATKIDIDGKIKEAYGKYIEDNDQEIITEIIQQLKKDIENETKENIQ